MTWSFVFFFNSISLGIALAMDAFSVSLANGLQQPQMKFRKMCGIAGLFAEFQALMPLIGWCCVHTVVRYFSGFEALIPWIALGLLGYIGGKMLYDSFHPSPDKAIETGLGALLMQGIATSIDALSVGFTIADYNFPMAFACASMIAAVTFVICMAGLYIGKKAGTYLAEKAGILGGCILIIIGLEIFITSWF